jgi:hypothetical protein
MSYSAYLALALAVTGCAQAGSGAAIDQQDAGGGGGDRVDGGTDPIPNVDAAPPIDAPPLVDAPPGCTPITTQLLTNPNFDATPIGMGWTAMPINATYPIITADGTLIQSAPNKAWMGGLETTPNTDQLYQDVMVPAGTTMLALTGYYQIRSGDIPFLPIDFIDVQLTTTTGTLLESVLALDNTDATTQWTPISKTFAMPHAGQMVRLHVSTDSDSTDATSFFLDSLALTSTKCQ